MFFQPDLLRFDLPVIKTVKQRPIQAIHNHLKLFEIIDFFIFNIVRIILLLTTLEQEASLVLFLSSSLIGLIVRGSIPQM